MYVDDSELRQLQEKNLELVIANEMYRHKLSLVDSLGDSLVTDLTHRLADLVYSSGSDRDTRQRETGPEDAAARRSVEQPASVRGVSPNGSPPVVSQPPPGNPAPDLSTVLAEERQLIAQELHDGLTQQLTGIVLCLESVQQLLDQDRPAAEAKLTRSLQMARASLSYLRSQMLALRAPTPTREQLIPGLKSLVDDYRQRYGLTTSLRVLGSPRTLGTEVEDALLRVAQESLMNAAKHAQAKRVAVLLNFGQSELDLSVHDDGRGFDVEAVSNAALQGLSSMGLASMRQRVSAVGGRLSVESAPGIGTVVMAHLALNGKAT